MIKDRIYDAFTAGLDRKGFGQRRDRQVAELRGDVLEVGAGTGLNLPRYRSADLLVALEPHRTYSRRLRARAGAAHVPVEVVAGTAEELPFADESFDVVSGFNSFQYAASPESALAEARRVLRPGGHLLAATWAPPEMCDLAGYLAALGANLPTPPAGAPGPFALSAEGALASLLASAGFEPQATRDVICRFDYRDGTETLRALLSAGPAVRAIRHAGNEAVERSVLESVDAFRQADGSYAMPNAFRFTLAIR